MRGTGRLLGVDFGQVRLGLAICDPGRTIASPLASYTRSETAQEARFFRRLVEEEDVGGIVVGLPVHLDGREGKQAMAARQFGQWLHDVTGLPVVFWDERFSSIAAEQALWQAGLTHKKRKARRDPLAAQIFLQAYLEAGCPPQPTFGPLEEE